MYKINTTDSLAWWQSLNVNQMDDYSFKYFKKNFETLSPLEIHHIYLEYLKGNKV